MSSSTQRTIQDKTLSGLENLNRVLPTGTVFLYQLLSPVLTNYGQCSETIYKYLTATLVGMVGLSCFITSFTDSYVGDDGKTHYVIPSKDLLVDFVHGLFALTVFGVLVLLDHKTVGCFFPVSAALENTLLKVLPTAVGVASSVLFMFFPTKRHGIGYPSSTDSSRVSKSGGGEVSLPKA